MGVPKRVKLVSVENGRSAEQRRILAEVSDLSEAPSSANDGFSVGRVEYAHLFYKVTGVNARFRVVIWYYSSVPGDWFEGEEEVLKSTGILTIEPLGLERFYIQIIEKAGTAPKLSMWGAEVVPT
jgi:hypothetical protein